MTTPKQLQPAWTWEWKDGWCVIRVDGESVTEGRTMAEALQKLGDLFRRADIEAKARKERMTAPQTIWNPADQPPPQYDAEGNYIYSENEGWYREEDFPLNHCLSCMGNGRCLDCIGRGYEVAGVSCRRCSASGVCSVCSGTGQRPDSQ